MVNIPVFTGFDTSQVVQDFFHQQYNPTTLVDLLIFLKVRSPLPIRALVKCVGQQDQEDQREEEHSKDLMPRQRFSSMHGDGVCRDRQFWIFSY